MPDTDLHQPVLGPLRVAAEAAELAQAVSGLVSADGYHLSDRPAAPLARDIARSMTEAGLPLHHCASITRATGSAAYACCYRQDRPMAVPGSRCRGPRTACLLDLDRYGTCTGTRQAMNTAIGGNLRAFGYPPGPFGSGGAWLVTGHREQDPGAGR